MKGNGFLFLTVARGPVPRNRCMAEDRPPRPTFRVAISACSERIEVPMVAVLAVARGPVPRDASSCLTQDLQDYLPRGGETSFETDDSSGSLGPACL